MLLSVLHLAVVNPDLVCLLQWLQLAVASSIIPMVSSITTTNRLQMSSPSQATKWFNVNILHLMEIVQVHYDVCYTTVYEQHYDWESLRLVRETRWIPLWLSCAFTLVVLGSNREPTRLLLQMLLIPHTVGNKEASIFYPTEGLEGYHQCCHCHLLGTYSMRLQHTRHSTMVWQKLGPTR